MKRASVYTESQLEGALTRTFSSRKAFISAGQEVARQPRARASSTPSSVCPTTDQKSGFSAAARASDSRTLVSRSSASTGARLCRKASRNSALMPFLAG